MMDLDPLSQLQVQQRIQELNDEASRNTAEHAKAVDKHYRATRQFKLAYARAYLMASGTVPERESRALLQAEQEYIDHMHAEGVMKAAQEAGRNTRAQLEASRTLAADIRDAVTHSSGTGA